MSILRSYETVRDYDETLTYGVLRRQSIYMGETER